MKLRAITAVPKHNSSELGSVFGLAGYFAKWLFRNLFAHLGVGLDVFHFVVVHYA